MTTSPLSFSARPSKRPRLIGSGGLAALAAGVALLLALSYRGADFFYALALRPPDANSLALTQAYLQLWLKVEPRNQAIRLALARGRIATGDGAGAERELRQLLSSPASDALRAQAALLLLDLSWRHRDAAPPDTEAWRRAGADCGKQLNDLQRYTWSDEQLRMLALRSADLGDWALARAYSDRITDAAGRRFSSYRELAGRALAHRAYVQASQDQFAAMTVAPTVALRRAAFIAGVGALQAGDRVLDALDAGRRQIGVLADDPPTLEFMTRLALAANRPGVAADYAGKMLRLRSDPVP
jgi:hypothetical protein